MDTMQALILGLFLMIGLIGFMYFIYLWREATERAKRIRELEYEKEILEEVQRSRGMSIDAVRERMRKRFNGGRDD